MHVDAERPLGRAETMQGRRRQGAVGGRAFAVGEPGHSGVELRRLAQGVPAQATAATGGCGRAAS